MDLYLSCLVSFEDYFSTLMGYIQIYKVVSNSPGLVDFGSRLVNSVLNLPNGQVKYFEECDLRKNCQFKEFGGLVEVTFELVNASFSWPEWQAVKMTFFPP